MFLVMVKVSTLSAAFSIFHLFFFFFAVRHNRIETFPKDMSKKKIVQRVAPVNRLFAEQVKLNE